MTLRELMEPLGIKNPPDLAHRTGLSRQLCYTLWQGKAFPGRKSAKAIQKATGVALELLLAVEKNGR